MINNYTNLVYANQLKAQLSRSITSVIRNKKNTTECKKHKKQCFECTVAELNYVFRKKDPPIFIYKGMTLTLKLLPLSSDSTKMPFLPAIRPPAPVIRLWIVTPHARLHVEP